MASRRHVRLSPAPPATLTSAVSPRPANGSHHADPDREPATPFQVPSVRAGRVRRPALVRRMAAGRDARLLLVAAPAGYGKSTAVAQWASDPREDRRFAWVSLDRADDDPSALCAHVVHALTGEAPAPGTHAERLLTGAVAGLEGPTVLVLDDYHTIRDPRCHDEVSRLLRRAPSLLQVVLTTRADPPMPLGSLRATGRMAELRVPSLRFTPEEARTLVENVAGVRLADRVVHELVERTEGWPAGLYLAALCLQDGEDPEAFVHDFAGDHEFVVDYLADEVLRGLPERTRRFLLRTSVLDRLTAGLCDTVAAADASASLLDDLRRSNEFLVPLDSHGGWFRYHRMFAQTLRSELDRTEPALVPLLHQRAGAWHDAHGSPDQAVAHALAAGGGDEAVDLVAHHLLAYVNRGRVATVRDWLAALGEETLRTNAVAAVCAAWGAALSGQRALVHVWLDTALRLGHDGTMPDGSRSLESAVALVQATFSLGGVAAMRDAAERAAACEDDPTSPWYALARYSLGCALLATDEADVAVEPLEEAGRCASNGPLVDACVLSALSLAVGELGQNARADTLARSAAQLVAEHRMAELPQASLADCALAAVHAHEGRLDEARAALEHALAVRRPMVGLSPLPTLHALCALAEVLDRQGERARARETVAEARRALAGEFGDASGLLARLDAVAGRLRDEADDGEVPYEALTDREETVLRLLQGDRSLREIGSELFLSSNTVKTHTRAIYRKLGVGSRAAAVTRARQLGLVRFPAPRTPPHELRHG